MDLKLKLRNELTNTLDWNEVPSRLPSWPWHMMMDKQTMNIKHPISVLVTYNSSEAMSRNRYPITNSIHLWSLSWPKIIVISVFIILVLVTIIGNTLVVLSVLTTRRLRTVTNCFVMNLAITDWLVGTCVMPPSIVFFIIGSWRFGWILCDIWISLDVLLCTASILSLCAISLDRYLSVIMPLKYSKKRRSKRLALLMILVVWITAFSITCPPFFGWYEPERRKNNPIECRYNQNKSYVVFSAMGSFFIPLSVMVYVYFKIGLVLTSRQQRMVTDAASEKCNGNEVKNDVFESGKLQCNSILQLPKLKRFGAKEKENVDLNDKAKICELVEVSRLSSNASYCSDKPGKVFNYADGCTSYSDSYISKKKLEFQTYNSSNQRSSHNISHRIPMRVSTSRKEKKTTKTLTTVMGGFIACWLPFFCYYLLLPFLPKWAVSEGLMFFLTWVGWINCSINPFIYAFYNPDFRTAFWRLTFRNIFKRQSVHQSIFKGSNIK